MAKKHCTHCGDEAHQHCTGCKVVKYCSEECQEADWKFHKLLCKQWESFAEKPEGEKEVRRVILLPQDSETPVFYWMPVQINEGDESDERVEDAEDIEVASDGVAERDAQSGSVLVGDAGVGIGHIYDYRTLVLGKHGHGELLDHSVKLMCKDYFLSDPPNPCLARILGGAMARMFRGPLVFLGMTKVDDPRFVVVVDASDFTLALDGLVHLAAKQADPIGSWLKPETLRLKKVQGVQINTQIPYYEEVKVLRTNEIFAAGGKVSAVSQRLGMSLLTATTKDEAEHAEESSREESAVHLASYLHISIDPISSTFGTVPEEYKSITASTMVFRADKMPIGTSMLVALGNFIKDVAQPLFGEARTLGTQQREAAVDAVVKMWKERLEAEDDDSASEDDEEDDEDGAGYYDGGAYDDMADVQAKMGQMQMTTVDARTGGAYI